MSQTQSLEMVSEETDRERLEQWARESKLTEDTVKLLVKNGFASMEAIELLDEEDLMQCKLPRGQKKLILKATVQWRGPSSIALQIPTSGRAADQTPGPRPVDNSLAGQSGEGLSQEAEERDRTEPHDSYVSEVLGSFQAIQSQQRAGNAEAQAAAQALGLAAAQPPRAAGSSLPVFTSGGGMLNAASWQDPQVHLSTAAGKTLPSFLDITDFVNVGGAAHEEVVVNTDNGPQLVLRSGSRKPKLENVSIPQWSVANLAILHTIAGEKGYNVQDIMDYLSHTTRVCQLFQRFQVPSVLLYDREYRRTQAQHGFRWGTEMPHLQICFLQARNWQNSHVGQQRAGPNYNNSGSNNMYGGGYEGPARRGPVTSDGKEICKRFNSTRGCRYTDCRYVHACSVPRCGEKHPAPTHDVLKNGASDQARH